MDTPDDWTTNQDALNRYPRLIEHLQASFVLSDGEAASAIRDYKNGYGYGCEAVAHVGGPAKAIRKASRDHSRHHNRETWLKHH